MMLADDACRPLQPTQDWPFFDADCHVAPELLAQVHALTPQAAAQVWRRHVSAHADETHPMRLCKGHRLAQGMAGPAWQQQFDAVSTAHPAQEGSVAQFLARHFHASDEAPVFFMASRVLAYALTPAALAACWPCLLMLSDEGPLLYQPATGRFACFRPQGQLAAGEDRSARYP